jgi:hypothetical protein
LGRLGASGSVVTRSKLAQLTSRKRFPRLVAALVRVDLEHTYDEIRQAI